MFNRVGSKIRLVAKILFWAGLVVSVILWFIVTIRAVAIGQTHLVVSYMLAALIWNLLNCILCWLLYGYGQIIDNTDKLVAQKEKEKEKDYEFNDI